MRAALEWLLERHDAQRALSLAVALFEFWETRGNLQEARHWLERALATHELSSGEAAPSNLRAQALSDYATVLRDLSEFEPAELQARKALDLWRALGDTHGVASALEIIGSAAMLREDYDRARALLEEALVLARGIDYKPMIGRVVHSLGRVAIAQRNWEDAHRLISESLSVHKALGSRALVASAYNNLGLVARYSGDMAQAREMLLQALTVQQEVGDRPRLAITRLNIGTINRLDGRYAESLSALEIATTEALEIGERRVQAWCIKELGHLAIAGGLYETGLRLLGAAEAWRQTIGMSFNPAGPEEIARDRAIAESALGPVLASSAWEHGHNLSLEEAFSEAQESLTSEIFEESCEKKSLPPGI
jgi:tetratricopeptide (TPR) repeat protein